MSSFQEALQKILNDLSPSIIIDEDCVSIFHSFFAKGTSDEFVQFKPSTFNSEHSRLSHHLQNTPSISHASRNVSDSTRTIFAGGPNSSSFEPTASIPCIPSRPMRKKRSIDFNLLTPESFKRQKSQHAQPSAAISKLIKGINEHLARESRELTFYRTLWDDTKACQLQNHITSPIHRYKVLQRMIDDSAENETKHIYRQRIAHILGAHELEVIDKLIPAGELSKGVRRRTITISKLSDSLGISRDVVINDNTRRRHYLSFFFEFGPGAVVLLGDNMGDILENRLSENCVASDIQYIRNNLDNFVSRCKKINFAVAISILEGLLISGWDGKSHYETKFMNHLGKFIDLRMFQERGEFRFVSQEESSSMTRFGGSSETPAETRSDDNEADSSLGVSDTPVTRIQDISSASEASPLDTRSPSSTDETSIDSQQHLPSNTDFWAVIHDRPVDRANSQSQSGQYISNIFNGNTHHDELVPPTVSDSTVFTQDVQPTADSQTVRNLPTDIGQIPTSGNLEFDGSDMRQTQAEPCVSGHGQIGSLRHPSPYTAFAFYPKERTQYGDRTYSLQNPRVSDLMVREPGARSHNLCEIGISGDFSFLGTPFNDAQFNPQDILETPFNDAQFNPQDILETAFNDAQFNPQDILETAFNDAQFNPQDILGATFSDAQCTSSDNTNRGWLPNGSL